MKNFTLASLALVLLCTSCISDDDGGATFLLPNPNDLLIEVTWTEADADFDLTLTGPGGIVVDLTDSPPVSGTMASITASADVLSGPGTESIRFNNSAPDGDYAVSVELFDLDNVANADMVLTATSQTITRSFNQTQAENDVFTVRFTKTGGVISFQ